VEQEIKSGETKRQGLVEENVSIKGSSSMGHSLLGRLEKIYKEIIPFQESLKQR
jgi:hypothetical protein